MDILRKGLNTSSQRKLSKLDTKNNSHTKTEKNKPIFAPWGILFGNDELQYPKLISTVILCQGSNHCIHMDDNAMQSDNIKEYHSIGLVILTNITTKWKDPII